MIFSRSLNCIFGQEEEIVSDAIMKMLFPPNDGAKVKEVRKKLSNAGIRCRVRKLPLTEGLFGIPPYPELFIENERDILRALKLIGKQQLSRMTVVFPTH
jgi:hypothetical protein